MQSRSREREGGARVPRHYQAGHEFLDTTRTGHEFLDTTRTGNGTNTTMLDKEQSALFPKWVTFASAMMACMASLLTIIGVTARGMQTEGQDEDMGCCAKSRRLLACLCASSSKLKWWQNGLLKISYIVSATSASTAISLVLTNLNSTKDETLRETILLIINEVLGDETSPDDPARNKRSATPNCLETNDSRTPCSTGGLECDFQELLQSQLNSYVPPACAAGSMILIAIIFAALLLAVTAAATVVCNRMRLQPTESKNDVAIFMDRPMPDNEEVNAEVEKSCDPVEGREGDLESGQGITRLRKEDPELGMSSCPIS